MLQKVTCNVECTGVSTDVTLIRGTSCTKIAARNYILLMYFVHWSVTRGAASAYLRNKKNLASKRNFLSFMPLRFSHSIRSLRMGLQGIGSTKMGRAPSCLRRPAAVTHCYRSSPGHPHLHPGNGAHWLSKPLAGAADHH